MTRIKKIMGEVASRAFGVLGLMLISAAAFTVALPLGLLTSGICLLLIDWGIEK